MSILATFADSETVAFKAPDKTGGMPLMAALAARRSTRKFDKAPLPQDVLGDLLWASIGISHDGRPTAPTAMNLQELEVYVLKEDGCWKYDSKAHAIQRTSSKDLRRNTVASLDFQPFVVEAPVTLVIVSDKDVATSRGARDWSEVDSGYVSQNIYLYCASKGLATVVRGSFPPSLAKDMGLPANKRVILCQCVGFPAQAK